MDGRKILQLSQAVDSAQPAIFTTIRSQWSPGDRSEPGYPKGGRSRSRIRSFSLSLKAPGLGPRGGTGRLPVPPHRHPVCPMAAPLDLPLPHPIPHAAPFGTSGPSPPPPHPRTRLPGLSEQSTGAAGESCGPVDGLASKCRKISWVTPLEVESRPWVVKCR